MGLHQQRPVVCGNHAPLRCPTCCPNRPLWCTVLYCLQEPSKLEDLTGLTALHASMAAGMGSGDEEEDDDEEEEGSGSEVKGGGQGQGGAGAGPEGEAKAVTGDEEGAEGDDWTEL